MAERIYGASLIHERHRHRFEFNCLYEASLAEQGMRVSGRSPDGKFVEIAELPSHPWFLAVQFHPEFQSKPLRPHPLFASFVEASYRHKTRHPAVAGVTRSRPASGHRIRSVRPRSRRACSRLAAGIRWSSSSGPCVIESAAARARHRRGRA